MTESQATANGGGTSGSDRCDVAQRLRAEVAARIATIVPTSTDQPVTPLPDRAAVGPGERGDAHHRADRASEPTPGERSRPPSERDTASAGSDTRVLVADVYVGWHAALAARTCPTRYRAEGDDGWGFPGWSAWTAAASIGRAALDHHLRVHDQPPGWLDRPVPLPAPLAAVRAWMQAMRTASDCAVGDWVAERINEGDAATLAAAAAGAARWMAGFVRVLGWPLPEHLCLLTSTRDSASPPLRWRPGRDSPVTVASGADARWGRVSRAGDFSLVVHRVSAGEDGRVRDRAAFEAAAATLAIGVVPAQVVLTAGDTGERLRVAVDRKLLALGADLVTGVVRQRVLATALGADTADATPSPACRHCPLLTDCDPGRTWLAGPGRWRGGLPTL